MMSLDLSGLFLSLEGSVQDTYGDERVQRGRKPSLVGVSGGVPLI